MQVFDASSMIYAWDNYPLQQFPGLWEWMAGQIDDGTLVMSSVAVHEVSHMVPECALWLQTSSLKKIEVTNAIVQDAFRMKQLLNIADDSFHPKGVDENDLLIIATAASCRAELVSEESRQKLPDLPAKRKIPAVCAMDAVAVKCINFIDYIRQSNQVF